MTQAQRRGQIKYPLKDVQQRPSTKTPAAHQEQALAALNKWFKQSRQPKGGILVLPTGGGKTFTATRFLTTGPLSQGHKVIWLAHTHHLLDQAFAGFGKGPDGKYELGHMQGKRASITFRTVSGTIGHGKVREIKGTDDVVIITLQTLARAMQNRGHAGLRDFLNSAAQTGLTVVFDECHHAPASSYRRLIEALREAVPHLHLLGLTATPTYTNEKMLGHLARLFPQNILHQVSPQALMAAGVLARPIAEELTTQYQPEFSEKDYREWLGSNRDIPETIIAELAHSAERNALIADTYVQNREKYGQTIIFADRWYQCTALVELLKQRGVRAAAIFTHKDANPGSVEARNARRHDENAAVLEEFRKGELEVLVNIRMLTEGTDVPKVQTVFLTRQTTSRILLTQMIGRALRGPRFGGTRDAYIVAFIDEWKRHVNWARWDDLVAAETEDDAAAVHRRIPVETISIELIEHLARELDPGQSAPIPFLTLLPLGWYGVSYDAAVKPRQPSPDAEMPTDEDSEAALENEQAADNIETVRLLIPVFDRDQASYKRMFRELDNKPLEEFEDVELSASAERKAEQWAERFFPAGDRLTRLEQDVLSIIRHRARNGVWPKFTPFEAREQHNMDTLALTLAFEQELSRLQEDRALREEFSHPDRLWTTLYTHYDQFKRQYNASSERLLYLQSHPEAAPDLGSVDEEFEVEEVPAALKKAIKKRDKVCLCCGRDTKLQVDHIRSRYVGGLHSEDNLQLLCRDCNLAKGVQRIDFRKKATPFSNSSQIKTKVRLVPESGSYSEPIQPYLKRIINMAFESSAVESITFSNISGKVNTCNIYLHEGNDPAWIQATLDQVFEAWTKVYPYLHLSVSAFRALKSRSK
jgi:superfamily II DNA or RNA helicase